MESHPLGLSGLSVSPLILGTLQLSDHWASIGEAQMRRVIHAAVDAGITTFDTASCYSEGRVEQLLGSCLRDKRSRVVYATKVSQKELRYSQVIASCERSLKNLGTDYIDLFEIHWPAGSMGSTWVPIDETMAAMNELKRQGKILAIGVSNFSLEKLTEASHYASIESLQIPYSLFWRQNEKLLPHCAAHGITVVAYSALAQGLLTGKYTTRPRFAPLDVRSKNKLFLDANFARVQRAMTGLSRLAEELGATPSQLALAWVVSHPNTCAVVGADTVAQVVENATAIHLDLTNDVLERMEAYGRLVTDHLDENDPVLWDWSIPKRRLPGPVSSALRKIKLSLGI